jgi:hypothetical protein
MHIRPKIHVALCHSEMKRSGIELMDELLHFLLQFNHANFRQCRQEKACFRMHMLPKIHVALCHSEMKRSTCPWLATVVWLFNKDGTLGVEST